MNALTPRALERRLKHHVYREPQTFLAVCAPGFEEVLLSEVRALPNLATVRKLRGGVEFSGPLESLYHANLQLTTAHRVLWRLDEFLAQSYPMLFNKARKVPWERFIGFEKEVAFHVMARTSRLHHEPKIAETLHSALQDVLLPLGLGASHTESAALELHARMFRDRCTLSLNTSGEHLHRRGYRTHVGDAPLRETLAAGMLLEVNAGQFDLIVDPLCGSGTLLLEAGRLARRRPAGEFRRFAFEYFPSFRAPYYHRLREAALHPPAPERLPRLYGFDVDERVLGAAAANAERAGVGADLELERADALTRPWADLKRPFERALLICNPPYGKRLGDGERFYRSLAAALKRTPGWQVALLTPNPAWLSGLPLIPRLRFQNGGLEVVLMTGTL